ncbi:alpha/beta fold hydrolase [Leptospira sp. GIMC2001]|uniref:alpha/beta fold hydrolase n=1 Tax=Leptospira sp. GIMC2001 TaxID=1513297 RepID=UPI00234A8479|nr:alpha/beta hydrolase [Leptospira sp. GIMC2001]WCL47808.1 alpha/beta hydrolase [Leptospira sp. GIMC2001]
MAENFYDPESDRKYFHWKHFTLSYTRHPSKKKGPLFILIGGWTSAPRYWDRNLNFFIERGEVVVLDLVGHFPATFSEDCHDLEMMDFLEAQSQAIIEIAGKKKPILVGHSTGGLAVLGAGALHPKSISKIVCIAPVVYGPVVGLFKTAVLMHRFHMGLVFELGFRATQMSEVFLEQGFLRGVRDPKGFENLPGMKDYFHNYFPMFKNLSGKHMSMILDMLDRTDIRPLMSDYKVPTLLIRSQHDPIVPPISSDHLTRDHASIQEVLFNESGHFVHLEQQEEFQRVVAKFLDHQNAWKK